MTTTILGVKWERFFVSAGIPSKIAEKYAKKFAEQRVQYEMLGDLTKPILVELGIVALGDQLAILHHARLGIEGKQEKMDLSSSPSIASASVAKANKNGSITSKSASANVRSNVSKKGLPAPDRDDIYHVRMPTGITPKTKEIMEKQTLLRSSGLMKRGSNGVRKSGLEVRPLSKAMVSRSGIGTMSSTEVSSTTSDVYGRLGVRGLVSDSMPEPKMFETTTVRRIDSLSLSRRKKVVDPAAALFKRSFSETTGIVTGEPVFRVRIPDDDMEEAGPSSRKAGIRERITYNKRPVVVQRRGLTKTNSHVNASGMVRKRAPIQSRLSLNRARVLSRKRFGNRGSASVFDRLG